jgi:hypothetical protein
MSPVSAEPKVNRLKTCAGHKEILQDDLAGCFGDFKRIFPRKPHVKNTRNLTKPVEWSTLVSGSDGR